MRAPARVFAGAPNPVLPWLVEAAAPLHALASSFLCEGPVHQGQREALDAVRSAGKAGKRSEDAGRDPLSRAPQ